eukprot:TRINITY_DN7573_c1_g1_i7.p2 TRINITY_DN7573_c1_g1~~TRINITY_DN7573_c1_g1_i7.p2  ORF type:complete len:178 (+),score=15.62 TRINITY_DN7573_c1_g1_i7:159-692(+)
MQVNSAKIFSSCSFQELNQQTLANQNLSGSQKLRQQQRLKSRPKFQQLKSRINVLNVECYQQQQQQQSSQQKQQQSNTLQSSNNGEQGGMFNFVDDDYLQQLIHIQSQDEQFLSQNGEQGVEELENQLAALLQQQQPLDSSGYQRGSQGGKTRIVDCCIAVKFEEITLGILGTFVAG